LNQDAARQISYTRQIGANASHFKNVKVVGQRWRCHSSDRRIATGPTKPPRSSGASTTRRS